jgi:CTP:phosphocholine cytidylyltransferase-like protein
MKAVILAAGIASRLRPLTDTKMSVESWRALFAAKSL